MNLQRHHANRLRVALGAAILLAVTGLLALSGLVHGRTDAGPRAVAPRGALDSEEQATIEVFRKTSPSVVHITTLGTQRDIFSMNVQQVPRGTGTGFVWDERGHVVTNFHVIQGGSGARVTLADQTSYPAKLVGAFPDRDLAVLKIDAPATKLPPIALGSSRELQVGQRVYAIGNPFGLDQTLTIGIVSALNREIESFNQRTIRGVIQTDAAINPGNSGGPLCDIEGDVIGINTAIVTGAEGLGFAIGASSIKPVVEELIKYGRVKHGWPGMAFWDISARMARQLGLTSTDGALVAEVYTGGPADDAGIKPGDVVLQAGGKNVTSVADIQDVLRKARAGDLLSLQLSRRGKTINVKLKLADVPEGMRP